MYFTILKLLSPYLQRRLANWIAGYLQIRREQRLTQQRGETEPSKTCECPPAEALLPAFIANMSQLSTQSVVWLTASGILLGSVFGFVLARFVTQDN